MAALTYGAGFIPQVDKIVGPGNAFVAAAKKLAFGTVDIDMIAGPSEVLVIADHTANRPTLPPTCSVRPSTTSWLPLSC